MTVLQLSSLLMSVAPLVTEDCAEVRIYYHPGSWCPLGLGYCQGPCMGLWLCHNLGLC